MNGKSKRKFTAQFKLKVVLEVLKEKETLAVISKPHRRTGHELHPNQISDWKKQFLYQASTVFESTAKPVKVTQDTDNALLYEHIGRLQMELTFFKKS